MEVHHAGGAVARADTQGAPQQQIVERGFPILSLDDIDAFAVDQPLGEQGGVPGEPLIGKVRLLETLELPRHPALGAGICGAGNISLADAMDDLPENQRQVFVMHELEGKSFKEIAELTGEGVNTLISRGRPSSAGR